MIIVISRFSGASDHDVQWTGALSWRRYVCHLNTSPATATPTCARKKAVPRGFSQTNEKPFGHRSTVKINVVHVHTIHGCGRISGAHILHEPSGPNIGGGARASWAPYIRRLWAWGQKSLSGVRRAKLRYRGLGRIHA